MGEPADPMIRRLAARAAIAALTPVVWLVDAIARPGDDALADLTTCHCGGDVNDRHHHLGVHAPTPESNR